MISQIRPAAGRTRTAAVSSSSPSISRYPASNSVSDASPAPGFNTRNSPSSTYRSPTPTCSDITPAACVRQANSSSATPPSSSSHPKYNAIASPPICGRMTATRPSAISRTLNATDHPCDQRGEISGKREGATGELLMLYLLTKRARTNKVPSGRLPG